MQNHDGALPSVTSCKGNILTACQNEVHHSIGFLVLSGFGFFSYSCFIARLGTTISSLT